MSKLEATYSVVLRAGVPPPEQELFELLCGRITSATGEALLHFNCTEIDASHHALLQMETFLPGDETTHPVRVPYQYVLLISGNETKAAPGFLTGVGAGKGKQ